MNRSDKTKKIILEMFEQRNYTNIETDISTRILAIKPDGQPICAFTKIIDKLNNEEIHSRISELQEYKIEHGILIHEGTPTPAVKGVISNLPDLGINIELFHADDLQFNITKHDLVPTHVLISSSEAKEFKTKYGTNIPSILRTDAVSRFFDFHKGDIIRIIRKNGFISYRIVR
jgi:DNA-directed RNA polymerase I, II, and III subunit RPABC1